MGGSIDARRRRRLFRLLNLVRVHEQEGPGAAALEDEPVAFAAGGDAVDDVDVLALCAGFEAVEITCGQAAEEGGACEIDERG